MLHLLLLHYTVSEEAAAPFVPAHVAYLERHHGEGTFLVSGRTSPASIGGAIVARGVDRAAIERIAAQDPFVVNGVAAYTITTIVPGRVHPALAGLLGQDRREHQDQERPEGQDRQGRPGGPAGQGG